MPAGMQVFGSNGALLVDVTNRLTRVTGEGTTTANVAGAITIPGTGSSTPFFVVTTTPHYPFNSVYTTNIPTFTLTGNVLSWTAAPGTATFLYGAY